MMPPITKKYMLTGLAGTPDILERLCAALPVESDVWDFRPDTDRLTLREILGHLANFEPVARERVILTCEQDNPYFARMGAEPDYSGIDPLETLARMRAGRAALLEVLNNLTDEQWERPAVSQFIGPITIEAQAMFLLAHDSYHTTQIAQWLALAESGGV